MSDFEKIKKTLKNDMTVLFAIQLLGLVYSIFEKKFNYSIVIFALLFLLEYAFVDNGKKIAGIIGIILSIFLIISGNIINILLGMFVILHSFKYNKLVKSNN